jgi:hypothetical protein
MTVLKRRPIAELFARIRPDLPRDVLISNTESNSMYSLSLRYFDILLDMNTTCDWVENQFASLLPKMNKKERFEYLKITNELNLGSDKAQVFSCFEGDILLAQADICRATADGRFIGFGGPNDITLSLTQSPKLENSETLFNATLQMCLRYFASFESVDRVLMAWVAGSPHMDWLARAGFAKIGNGDSTTFRAAIYAFTTSPLSSL